MKKIITILFALTLVSIWFVQNVNAQVTVTGSTGADATYGTLALAFTAINGTAQTGNNIVITITASVTDNNTATLNAGVWTTLKIYPTTSGLTLSGSIAAPLIDLNGADNVTIDGRVYASGSTIDLTITNQNTGSSASTIRFIESAENNKVEYCTIKGAETNSSSGVILFSTSTSGNGNGYNTIDNCNLTNDGGNRPYNVIYSSGSSGYGNSNNTISNNYIYNFFNAGATSHGIYISSYSTDWTITGNSFYQTTTLEPTGSYYYYAIRIAYASGSAGNNFTITGNYIGGSEPECGGSAFTMNASVTYLFRGIFLAVGTTVTSVQNNIIKNISQTTTAAVPWCGIYVSTGSVNIGTVTGNTIGATTGTGSITITYTKQSGSATSYGIYKDGAGAADIENNNIGSITIVGSESYCHSFYAIYKPFATGAAITINNNLIGSTGTANSIQTSTASASATGQNVYGIYNAGMLITATISNNTIANMYNAYAGSGTTSGQVVGILTTSTGINTIQNNTIWNLSTTSPNTDATTAASVIGISQRSTTAGQTVSGNTIYNLSNTNSSNAVCVTGLYYAGPSSGTNTVSKNFIHSLSISSTSTSSIISGIKINAGATTYSNNIINLGGSITNGNTIYGIYENGASSNNNNLYFNTVYIGGSLSVETSSTYALYNNANTNTRNFRNNIFYNARSGGTTGKHYAVSISGTTGLTIDYNDCYAPNTGGVLGYLSTDITTLSDWQTATGQDANSLNTNPNLTNAGSTTAADYRLTINHTGVDGTGITEDYSGYSRSGTPTIGAIEYDNPVPVELASFSANAVNSKVILNWSTATEVNNYGFSVERSEASLNNPEAGASSYIWETIGFVQGHGNSNSPKEYSFTDNNLQPGNIQYRLKQIDNDGSFTYSNVVETSINELPKTFGLFQNYPNPFNPTTKITYQIPENLRITLKLFDIIGNEVATLVNETKEHGKYEVTFNGSTLPSGTYFYRMQAGGFVDIKKFLLLK